jgi:hypothetical protein
MHCNVFVFKISCLSLLLFLFSTFYSWWAQHRPPRERLVPEKKDKVPSITHPGKRAFPRLKVGFE